MTIGLLAKKLTTEISPYYSKHLEQFKFIKRLMENTAQHSDIIKNEIPVIGNSDLDIQLYFKGVIDNQKFIPISLAIDLSNITTKKSRALIKVLKLDLIKNSEYQPHVYSNNEESETSLKIGDVVLHKNLDNRSCIGRYENDYFEITRQLSFPEYIKLYILEHGVYKIPTHNNSVIFKGKSIRTGETQYIYSSLSKLINEKIIKSDHNSNYSVYFNSKFIESDSCLYFYVDISENSFSTISNYEIPDRDYYLPNDFIFSKGNIYYINSAEYDFEGARKGNRTQGISYSCLNLISIIKDGMHGYNIGYLKQAQERYKSGTYFKGFDQTNVTSFDNCRFATKEEIMFYLSVAMQKHSEPSGR